MDDELAIGARLADAVAALNKTVPLDVLLDVLRAAAAGQTAFPPAPPWALREAGQDRQQVRAAVPARNDPAQHPSWGCKAGSFATADNGGVLVVLIHGAYTRPWHWHRLVPHLEDAGCRVVVPELPCDDVEAGIERYVATVEAALPEESEPPVVIGSSLGAVTACVFAARHPVRALVTVCGLVPAPGRAIAEEREMTQPEYAAAIELNPDGSTTFRPQAAEELVFHESEPDLRREAASRLRPQAALPLVEPCPFDAIPDVPRLGIVSSEDRLIRPEWLDRAVRERLGVEPHDLGGDHVPTLSQPERLAEALLGAPAAADAA